jgi:uncharacterized protein YjbI with pentapeptide repeats|tara:strand:+ start:1046 stop:1966 length:921 start_codon:yes stop_codon:yes gene_type:complete
MRWKAAAQGECKRHTTPSCPVTLDANEEDRYNPVIKNITMAALGNRLIVIAGLIVPLAFQQPIKADQDLMILLGSKHCPNCKLADADLVHADLRDANLSNAQMQRANLSRASLDGADLREANLSFSSLQGASLRGANLKGAKLYGTDFRDSDLTGAQLDVNALEEAHWRGAKGITHQAQSHAVLHNAGVSAAKGERWRQAEDLFSQAITKKPDIAESWVARAIARERLGKRKLAVTDFDYASKLFESQGSHVPAKQLKAAAISLQDKAGKRTTVNGAGSALLNGLISTSKALLPIAMKLFVPAIGF